MSDLVERGMDGNRRKRRNSKEEPPDMSGDSAREELKEMLLRLFEEKKQEIEGYLRELSGIADGLDEAHRKAAIAKTTGSCVSAAGGIMTIAGLALAPFTFGASTLLTVAGFGVGAAGGATSITTEVVKASSDRDDNKRVEAIVGIIQSKMSALGKTVNDACQAVFQIDAQHVLIKLAAVGVRVGVGDILADSAPLLLSKGSRVLGGALAGVFLVWDVCDITNNSIDIYKGCKSERAEEIRELVKTVKNALTDISAKINALGKL